MTDDRQTFAIGETIRQKHLDAVARDADRIATQQEAIDELVAFVAEVAADLPAEFRHDGSVKAGHVYRSYCAGRFDRARTAALALLSKHGERA